jgi:hypothetical protein
MSIREIDLAQFHDFARQQIAAGRGDVSLTSLAEQWERQQQSRELTESSSQQDSRVARARAYVDQLARQQGVVQIRTADELRFDLLNSEAEVEEFLAAVNAGRRDDHFRDLLND